MPDLPDENTVTRRESLLPERFALIRAVFEAALEVPPGQRRAYARGACGDDGNLHREVVAMLDAEEKVDPLLDGVVNKPSSTAPEEGRFPAGTVLAGRYRVLGMLGRGGMGEVYKAFDLILNQVVALKFLHPAHVSEAALARFRNEVRIARQVSHPNVCRVYDLGMVEGLHFLSMEYIDGEDLASLLRRIGRLPQDKAIEFTRKICSGLAAAHERGVLHRDLKPGNIMIDGRGQPRITDFGLAALAQEIPLSDLRSGTPAYMSPEQKTGKDVTTRSDIFSLGLVMHEMFTGKPREGTQSNPSDLVKDLDPALERLILRCLEEDPGRRPKSALSVAMALPGGDPIAAALAAGETPSPEMVAASQEKEGFSVRTAVLCFAAVIAALLIGIAMAGRLGFLAKAPLSHPPDALAYRAQQLIQKLGYTKKPDFEDYYFFCCDRDMANALLKLEKAKHEEILASHRPALISFFYRQGNVVPFSRPANAFDLHTRGASTNTVFVLYDAEGRLLELEAQPMENSESSSGADWPLLFSEGGLDEKRFTAVVPEIVPRVASNSRVAWEGTYSDNRPGRVRVEGASWGGRVVEFHVRPIIAKTPEDEAIRARVAAVFSLVILAGAIFAAWRNSRQMRIDKKGGYAIAFAAVALGWTGLLLRPPFLPIGSFELVISAVLIGILLPMGCWMLYLATEPFVRRYWPDALISWSRFRAGEFNNPLVATHILAGVAVAEIWSVVAWPAIDIATGYTAGIGTAMNGAVSFGSAGYIVAQRLMAMQEGLSLALIFLFLNTMCRLWLKKLWVADTVAAILTALLITNARDFGAAVGQTAGWLAFMWLLRRFGMLAYLTGWVVQAALVYFPLTTTGWLAKSSLTYHAIPAAIAAWAVWVIACDSLLRPADRQFLDPA